MNRTIQRIIFPLRLKVSKRWLCSSAPSTCAHPETSEPLECSEPADICFDDNELYRKVFRAVYCDECLGPGAGKECIYKNNEYYSYHKYSFITTHALLKDKRAYAKPAPAGKKN